MPLQFAWQDLKTDFFEFDGFDISMQVTDMIGTISVESHLSNTSSVFVLKVWSTVQICGTRAPQKAIVPVGRPRPYSIIKLNMRFIPKASLRASSQITASSDILERHL